MRCLIKIVILAIAIVTSIVDACAQSPREQLEKMVLQLQKNPDNNALRARVIRLAGNMNPAPSVPEKALEYASHALSIMQSSVSRTGLYGAVREYEKAIAAAPWVPGYYSDLCTIYEKAEKYAEAKKNCEFGLA